MSSETKAETELLRIIGLRVKMCMLLPGRSKSMDTEGVEFLCITDVKKKTLFSQIPWSFKALTSTSFLSLAKNKN